MHVTGAGSPPAWLESRHPATGGVPAGGQQDQPLGLVAVVVGFGAWWTYFDFAGQRRPRPVRRASLRWVLGHLPLPAGTRPEPSAGADAGG